MDKIELMAKISKKEDDLINTSMGLLDILSCNDTHVTYGFLAGGDPVTEDIQTFLSRFGI